jgi:hypothetical protein
MADLSITRIPSERNPSELLGELDRNEEEDVDFEIPPKAGDPTKKQSVDRRAASQRWQWSGHKDHRCIADIIGERG